MLRWPSDQVGCVDCAQRATKRTKHKRKWSSNEIWNCHLSTEDTIYGSLPTFFSPFSSSFDSEIEKQSAKVIKGQLGNMDLAWYYFVTCNMDKSFSTPLWGRLGIFYLFHPCHKSTLQNCRQVSNFSFLFIYELIEHFHNLLLWFIFKFLVLCECILLCLDASRENLCLQKWWQWQPFQLSYRHGHMKVNPTCSRTLGWGHGTLTLWKNLPSPWVIHLPFTQQKRNMEWL